MRLPVEPRSPWVMHPQSTSLPPSIAGWLEGLVGEPPATIAAALMARDFAFLARNDVEDRAEIFAAAEAWIDHIPSLSSAVRGVVRQIFVLRAPEEYDISHSEPRWPSWIFVSSPGLAGAVSGLRLAENVVHEAMHLQLTELESRTPLVADTVSRLPSPWKQEARQLQGILHGFYVFACISAFYRRLEESGSLPSESYGYVCRRIKSIGEEVATVSLNPLASGLTDAGRQLLGALCEPITAVEQGRRPPSEP